MVQFTGAAIIFHLSMVLITVDRLLVILLNIKYPVYWSEDKAKKLLLALWTLSGVITIVVALCQKYADFEWENYFFTYFFPIIEFFFIGLALATYLFIFKKFRIARIVPVTNVVALHRTYSRKEWKPEPPQTTAPEGGRGGRRGGGGEAMEAEPTSNSPVVPFNKRLRQRRSSIQTFRKSKFFIPVLLILTFLIFIVGADMIMLFAVVMGGNSSKWLAVTLQISYSISNLLDAWIYIILEPELKTLLVRKLKVAWKSNTNGF